MFEKIKNFFLRPRQLWEKNLIVLWIGTFMAGIAFSLVMPFLSLYIDTLGKFSSAQLNLYSGLTYSATFLVMAIVSPIWGRLADRRGRKLMILRASFGMAIVIAAMGLVTNVTQLILLRLLQGVFSGYVSNSNALIATETPKQSSGKALGILITGNVTGTLFGPLVGGVVAAIFGYRLTFFLTGLILFLVFLLSAVFVKENFQPVPKNKMQTGATIFRNLKNRKIVFGMLVTTLLIQLGNFSISPIISLYIRDLMHHAGPITIASGIIASLPGIATLLAAPRLGALGDKIGTARILKIGMLFAVAIFLPMALVTNIWQFGSLRFLVGISDGALLPAVQTLLAKNTPAAATGRIFSYNQSFQAMGNVLGPLLGSTVSGIWNYNGVFISTAVVLFMGFLWVTFATKEPD
ncbi:multidrug efflux MFS transporter [Liquorilactobacillus satsumensis]|uniref:multidrug efflux MFS transporter n=1 Tax=Liquorilactobacillus satsumensis TaxID=259059 RepID=UPI001E4DEB7D|nr:multidrug efflux MFS transporter [Liquorilactobacillus satsumensis]MCC7667007.1 multidrug transporter subunit MdtG [Liquorilactobacillus satsumensis]MCP9358152.1 multidrug efflux MFS transporter [Liquorilactobacillus satsumensis]MCP9372163.1 multidrug efflux MFS transporter [Liquorilactobacillus satsumensis]